MSIFDSQKHFDDAESMSQAAALMIVEQAKEAQKARGLFTLVLSGGGTPRRLYEILAAPPVADQIDWQRCFVFWGDERLVPLDHPHSNYKLANEHLLPRLPAANIFPVPVDAEPQNAAARYEDEIREFWQSQGRDYKPLFDCVLLGMGPDGHCVSLFPDSPLLAEKSSLVAAISEPEGSPPVPRVTLTLPGLAASRMIMFLISGGVKAGILAEIQAGETRYPAARVRSQGKVKWLVSA
jgi:6-phosphogluconolactonase